MHTRKKLQQVVPQPWLDRPRTGVVVPNPPERFLSVDEQRVIDFLQHGVDGALEKINQGVTLGKFGTAADGQATAITLQTAIDAIRAGLHDKDHVKRHVNPREEARLHFGGMHPYVGFGP